MMVYRAIGLAFILFMVPVLAYPASLDQLRLSLIDGDVQISSDDHPDWFPASVNMPLKEGDRIWVPDGGRAEIQTNDGSYVRLNGNTSLDVLRIDRGAYQFHLAKGHVYVNCKNLRGGSIQIDNPSTSVRVYEGSIFRVDVSDDGFADVSVLKGSVIAEGSGGTRRVYEGKTLSLGGDESAELSPLGTADDWERWNRERDNEFYERRYSRLYLPSELDTYSYDFDRYGKWVYTRDYGYAWTPAFGMSTGWSPYRSGRWTWIGGDYVWVPYEPWGWVPYHYGRWFFVIAIGWCWIPPVSGAVYWGPGYVGWVYTPAYVAWVPLAPGEIYYGYGRYGPHSVNIINVNIVNINKTIIYRNASINNAVTVLHRDTFLTGRHHDLKVRENPFLKHPVSIGRPQIAPERSSFVPVLKETPREKQPPQKVRDSKILQVKGQRPLARQRSDSVLNPGTRQRSLPVKISNEPVGTTQRTFMERPGLSHDERTEQRIEERRKQQETKSPQIERPERREMERQAPIEKSKRQEMERPEGRQLTPPERQKGERPGNREIKPQKRPQREGAERVDAMPFSQTQQRRDIEKQKVRENPPFNTQVRERSENIRRVGPQVQSPQKSEPPRGVAPRKPEQRASGVVIEHKNQNIEKQQRQGQGQFEERKASSQEGQTPQRKVDRGPSR